MRREKEKETGECGGEQKMRYPYRLEELRDCKIWEWSKEHNCSQDQVLNLKASIAIWAKNEHKQSVKWTNSTLQDFQNYKAETHSVPANLTD